MRFMWLPYYRGSRLAGWVEIACSENSLRAVDCDPKSGIGIAVASVELVPGREKAAAQVLLKRLQAWAQGLNCDFWPELETERWARAIAAWIRPGVESW